MEPPAAGMQRKKLILKARFAEKAKRYDHMVHFMREFVAAKSPEEDLSHIERCLLAVAFKNIVSAPRNAWISLSCSTQSRQGDEDDAAALAAAKKTFLTKMKTEITSICLELVHIINRRLLPTAITDESKVMYLTLKAEFSCYSAEVKQDEEGIRQSLLASEDYGEASYIASRLGALNPCRLALSLSLAELFDGYLGKPGEAEIYAEQALSESYRDLIDGPIYSISTFEGGLQLIAKLESLKCNQCKGTAGGKTQVLMLPDSRQSWASETWASSLLFSSRRTPSESTAVADAVAAATGEDAASSSATATSLAYFSELVPIASVAEAYRVEPVAVVKYSASASATGSSAVSASEQVPSLSAACSSDAQNVVPTDFLEARASPPSSPGKPTPERQMSLLTAGKAKEAIFHQTMGADEAATATATHASSSSGSTVAIASVSAVTPIVPIAGSLAAQQVEPLAVTTGSPSTSATASSTVTVSEPMPVISAAYSSDAQRDGPPASPSPPFPSGQPSLELPMPLPTASKAKQAVVEQTIFVDAAAATTDASSYSANPASIGSLSELAPTVSITDSSGAQQVEPHAVAIDSSTMSSFSATAFSTVSVSEPVHMLSAFDSSDAQKVVQPEFKVAPPSPPPLSSSGQLSPASTLSLRSASKAKEAVVHLTTIDDVAAAATDIVSLCVAATRVCAVDSSDGHQVAPFNAATNSLSSSATAIVIPSISEALPIESISDSSDAHQVAPSEINEAPASSLQPLSVQPSLESSMQLLLPTSTASSSATSTNTASPSTTNTPSPFATATDSVTSSSDAHRVVSLAAAFSSTSFSSPVTTVASGPEVQPIVSIADSLDAHQVVPPPEIHEALASSLQPSSGQPSPNTPMQLRPLPAASPSITNTSAGYAEAALIRPSTTAHLSSAVDTPSHSAIVADTAAFSDAPPTVSSADLSESGHAVPAVSSIDFEGGLQVAAKLRSLRFMPPIGSSSVNSSSLAPSAMAREVTAHPIIAEHPSSSTGNVPLPSTTAIDTGAAYEAVPIPAGNPPESAITINFEGTIQLLLFTGLKLKLKHQR